MTDVRVATPADEDQIMKLCLELHAENGMHAMNPDRIRAMVRRCLDAKGGIIGVIGEPGDLKGCILLLLDGIWYSDEFQLLELLNFVRADCRKSDYAKSLIGYAKRCADELGIDLMIGVISNIRTEAKIRLYERHFPKAGAFFVHRPEAKKQQAA